MSKRIIALIIFGLLISGVFFLLIPIELQSKGVYYDGITVSNGKLTAHFESYKRGSIIAYRVSFDTNRSKKHDFVRIWFLSKDKTVNPQGVYYFKNNKTVIMKSDLFDVIFTVKKRGIWKFKIVTHEDISRLIMKFYVNVKNHKGYEVLSENIRFNFSDIKKYISQISISKKFIMLKDIGKGKVLDPIIGIIEEEADPIKLEMFSSGEYELYSDNHIGASNTVYTSISNFKGKTISYIILILRPAGNNPLSSTSIRSITLKGRFQDEIDASIYTSFSLENVEYEHLEIISISGLQYYYTKIYLNLEIPYWANYLIFSGSTCKFFDGIFEDTYYLYIVKNSTSYTFSYGSHFQTVYLLGKYNEYIPKISVVSTSADNTVYLNGSKRIEVNYTNLTYNASIEGQYAQYKLYIPDNLGVYSLKVNDSIVDYTRYLYNDSFNYLEFSTSTINPYIELKGYEPSLSINVSYTSLELHKSSTFLIVVYDNGSKVTSGEIQFSVFSNVNLINNTGKLIFQDVKGIEKSGETRFYFTPEQYNVFAVQFYVKANNKCGLWTMNFIPKGNEENQTNYIIFPDNTDNGSDINVPIPKNENVNIPSEFSTIVLGIVIIFTLSIVFSVMKRGKK